MNQTIFCPPNVPKTFSQERLPKWQYPKRDFPSDNIPRETSQMTISQERLLKWQYPKRDFPSDYIPRETSQVTISQERLPKWLYPKWHIPKCAISLAATFQRLGYARQWGPSAVTRMGWGRDGLGLWLRHILTLGKLHIWKLAMESFRSEKSPWESTQRNLISLTSLFILPALDARSPQVLGAICTLMYEHIWLIPGKWIYANCVLHKCLCKIYV